MNCLRVEMNCVGVERISTSVERICLEVEMDYLCVERIWLAPKEKSFQVYRKLLMSERSCLGLEGIEQPCS